MGAILREWLIRIGALVRPRRSDADLEAELRAHLALADEHAANGSGPAPLTCRRNARLRAGGVDQSMEPLRDQRGVPVLRDLGRDLTEGARLFTRTPGVAVLAVFTLTLGLALALTVFRVVNAYELRGLPYPEAARMYSVTLGPPGLPDLVDPAAWPWDSLDDAVERRIAWNLDMVALVGGEYPEAVTAAWVTPDFVPALGVAVAMGRTLQAGDFAAAGPAPVLISHQLWTTRFGASPAVVGQSIRAYSIEEPDEADVFTVVGVLAPDFWHVNTYTDVIGPLRDRWWPYMLRLRPGVDADQVEHRIAAMARAAAPGLPADWRPQVVSTHARYVEALRPLLGALASVAAIVLLIACANVAVLLLLRAVRRQQEMAVRLALGASRARLARLLATEATLLAAASATLALLLSGSLVAAVAPALETHVGRRVPGGVAGLADHGTVALAAMALAAATAVALTLVPLAAASLPSLNAGLVASGRSSTPSRGARRVRHALVAAEVAGALALLVGATLMVESARRVVDDPVGVRGDVVVADVGLREHEALDGQARARLFTRIADAVSGRLGGVPVALGGRFPLQPTPTRAVATADGRSAGAAVLPVSSGYFATLGIALSDGRSFADDERPGGSPVAVVSQSLAARLWPAQRAVGQWVLVPPAQSTDAAAATAPIPHRVVGVAGDVQELSSERGGVTIDRDRLDLYVPLLQAPDRFAFLYLPQPSAGRETETAATVRRAVASVDAEAAVSSLRSLGALVDAVHGRPRRLAWLLSALAASAVALALVGVYGVLAYAVRHRHREIGVRMALGAAPREITGLFLREGARVLAAGLVAGVLGALALGQALDAQLVGVAPMDPTRITVALAALGLCGALAFWWPARRAARVAPADVLR